MIRITIVDDHAIVIGGLKQLFAAVPDFVMTATASNGNDLMALLRTSLPDIVLLDLSMPGISGVELVERLHRQFPQLPILVLSMHNEAPIVSRVLKAGALGYVSKDSEPDVLIRGIRAIFAKRRYIDSALVEKLVFGKQKSDDEALLSLSERELQVLTSFAAGNGINEIAASLCVSPKTISTHKMRLMQKLSISKNAELIRFAVERGLVGT